MNQEKINFRQARDFGETFNVSIKFLRQNFKLFFLSIIFFAGPFILISAIAGAFYQSHAINIAALGTRSPNVIDNLVAQFGLLYFIFLLSSILAMLSVSVTTYAYMLTYLDKGPNEFTIADVGKIISKNIGNVIVVFIVLGVFFLLIIGVIIAIFVSLAYLSPVLTVIIAIFAVFGLLIIAPPISWQVSATYLVKMYENRGIVESFMRTAKVMKGNFWWTWVIVFCAAIAISIAGFVFAIPQVVYNLVLTFSRRHSGIEEISIGFFVVSTVCTFLVTTIHSAMSVINGFHFFSLAEKKDGAGLMERINEIGNAPASNVEQQY